MSAAVHRERSRDGTSISGSVALLHKALRCLHTNPTAASRDAVERREAAVVVVVGRSRQGFI